MAFKLRSGNTTKFKSMGSSPAKQESDPILEDESQELTYEKLRNKKLEGQIEEMKADKDVGSERSRRILDGKGTDEDVAKQKLEQEERNKMASQVPWSEKVKNKHKYKEITGYDSDGKPIYGKNTKSDRWEDGEYIDADEDMTWAEKQQAKKERNERSKKALSDYLVENPEATKEDIKKFKKKEKYNRETQRLHQNYQDAQAKGTQGLRFNWKNLFLGGVEDAFTVDSKKDIIADKMKKRHEGTKTKNKLNKKKEQLKKDKQARKNQELERKAKQAEAEGNQKKADRLRGKIK